MKALGGLLIAGIGYVNHHKANEPPEDRCRALGIEHGSKSACGATLREDANAERLSRLR